MNTIQKYNNIAKKQVQKFFTIFFQIFENVLSNCFICDIVYKYFKVIEV